MKQLFYLFRGLFSVVGFVLFLSVMLLLFPFVFFASFFGKIKGGNTIYTICRLWADIMMVCWGIHHVNIFEQPHDPDKQYVFIFNHISFMDIPIIMKSIRKQHFRILGRSDLGKIPVFGFLYRNAVVMVDRSSTEKRAASVQKLKAVIRKGISVVIAPEGTFNNTGKPLKSFYDGAFKIAIETQTPIKPILFLDAADRLNNKNIFTLTPGRSRAVYLEEISVAGLTNRDVAMLKEKVYTLMEEKLISYKVSWIEDKG